MVSCINITIQERDGKPKITWLDKEGEMPEGLWTEINVALANAMHRYNKD